MSAPSVLRHEDRDFAGLPSRRRSGLLMMMWKSCVSLRGIG
jgi:hypothetical protein